MTEAISQAEFAELERDDELVLAFVGMSNCGKSWSAKRLAEVGFERVDCDALIQADVDDILVAEGCKEEGLDDIEAMAKWMGQPGDAKYPEREKQYLDLERQKLEDVLERVEVGETDKNTVIDTTGSVVHLPAEVRQRLVGAATVVLFEITAEIQEEMFAEYINSPKPLVWGTSFDRRVGETPEEARERCYPDLIQHRSGLYLDLAHVVIPRPVKYAFENTDDLLGHIKNALPV